MSPLIRRREYDSRAHRLVSGRLLEIAMMSEKESESVARQVLHTLTADGYVLARIDYDAQPGADGYRPVKRADDPAWPPEPDR